MIFAILHYELERQLQRIIENPDQMAVVQLRNKITIPEETNKDLSLIFITATDKFMFFYQYSINEESSAIAIPISSILNVRYSKFKINTTNTTL